MRSPRDSDARRPLVVVATVIALLAGGTLGALVAWDALELRIESSQSPGNSVVHAASSHQELPPDDKCTRLGSESGFGVLGDSFSDEYRADDARGGAFAATTFNWVELLAAKRGLNFGPWGTWGGPRRTGFEYNWARSGATTDAMIRDGYPQRLARQIADGKVSYVFIMIGINDFHPCCGAYDDIYNGSLSGPHLDAWLDRRVSNFTTAVDTLQAAGDVRIILITVPDVGVSSDIVRSHPEAARRQRVTDAVNRLNARLATLAADRRITLLDMSGWISPFLERIATTGSLTISSVTIDARKNGNDPHFMRLDDSIGHSGTVASGLFANNLGIRPLRETFGLCIEPLTDQEILEAAGIKAGV